MNPCRVLSSYTFGSSGLPIPKSVFGYFIKAVAIAFLVLSPTKFEISAKWYVLGCRCQVCKSTLSLQTEHRALSHTDHSFTTFQNISVKLDGSLLEASPLNDRRKLNIKFWGVPGGGGGWYSQTMSKYFSVKYLLISKKTGTLVQTVQKIHFWGVYLGVPWGGCTS